MDALVQEALSHNTEILAAQKRYQAAQQRSAPARSLPDPVLTVGYASNGGPLPGQGLGTDPTSNIGVMISQEMTAADKRRLRGEIASKEAEAAFEEWQAVQLSVRSRVIQAVHRLHHTYASTALLDQGKDVLRDVIRSAEARYTAGKTGQQDVFRAQTQLAMLEVRNVKMLQDRAEAVAEINSLLNRAPGSEIGEPMEDEPAALPMKVDELLAKAAAIAPELKEAIAAIQKSELGVNLAEKQFRPDVTIAAGYFNQGRMPAMYQVRVDIPLRLHKETRERPELNAQVNLLAESRRNFESAEQSLQMRVRQAYTEAETAWRLRGLYTDTILPQNKLTVEASLAAYESGTADLAQVLMNIAAQVDIDEEMHEQTLNYELAVTRMEEMTGVEMVKGEGR
jgi:outer membrane protein TolC